jgi:hypothetical protein
MCHQLLDLPSGGLDMVDDQLIEIGILMFIVDKQDCALTRVDLGNIYDKLALSWKSAAVTMHTYVLIQLVINFPCHSKVIDTL